MQKSPAKVSWFSKRTAPAEGFGATPGRGMNVSVNYPCEEMAYGQLHTPSAEVASADGLLLSSKRRSSFSVATGGTPDRDLFV